LPGGRLGAADEASAALVGGKPRFLRSEWPRAT
jgi:hypothetical protein